MEDLMIGGLVGGQPMYKDALSMGVRMGEGFLNAIEAPPALKSFVTSESRLQHGKIVVVDDVPKLESRDLTLTFTIQGKTHEDFLKNKNAFYGLLQKGIVYIMIPKESSDVYKLVYTGQGASFAYNRARTFCKISVKFTEPNPNDRK